MHASITRTLSRILFLSLIFVANVRAAERTAIERTRVSIVPPAGLAPDTRLRGFSDEKAGISILITEVPATPELTTRAFDEKGFSKQGMKFLGRELAKFGDVPGFIIQASGPHKGGGTDHKTIAAIGELETTLITATYPSTLAPARVAELRTALLSARIRPEFAEKDLDRTIPEPFLKMIPAGANGE